MDELLKARTVVARSRDFEGRVGVGELREGADQQIHAFVLLQPANVREGRTRRSVVGGRLTW